ncbi:MAG: trigger factor [Eubacteriales bacterium]
MNVKSKEKKEKSIVELTIEVSKEEFEQACVTAYKKRVKDITLPGFRKGKAPRKMIERMYGESFFWEDAVNESYPKAYESAIKETELNPVGRADMEIVDISSEGYTFKAMVPVKPEVSIADYKGIEAEKPNVEINDDEVDAEIERLRKRNARIETVEREIKVGDTAIIDFEGFKDGVPFEGGKAERHQLEIGSNSFIPGFEDKLVGAKAGDELDLDLTFPEQYHAEELAGKDVVFKVKVHEVKESILPELDDEFAKDVSEFDTLEQLKEDIKANLLKSREEAADNAFENAVFSKLVEKLQADIPEAMIDSRLDNMVEDFAYRISSQGIPFDQYLEMMGMNMDSFRSFYRPQAEYQVKLNLSLEKVAELENIEVGTEDVEEEYNKLAEQYNMEADKVKILLPEESMKSDLLMRKAADFVKENAVAVPPSDKAETTEEESSDKKDDAKGKTKTTKKTKSAAKTTKSKVAKSEEKPEKEVTGDSESTENNE